ncbi:phosphate ABC transporter permease subunit PstC [Anaeromicropila populeti]|uniref:Phosphate transport system permease protein n=1 Tax=Anaeromicropila populeti TaxID=37658 RepID=A0A1I6J9N5_9FIRM|nr:phosphate ABC transporter permease subunit PstC [Anaeromicropila populeti]SFR75664.1 phosphate ABC transporter membrane protein 1, PhoT family (TC 3.A.1.7.1) [Anaeromicropila populeti]
MNTKRMRNITENSMRLVFLTCAMISVISVLSIIAFVFYKGLSPFVGNNAYSFWKFISGTKWDPNNEMYGILYMIVASILGTLGAVAIGVPVGLMTAVFIAEIAPEWIVKIVRPAIELLAGIPSVIFGAFGLGVIVPFIDKISPRPYGQSLFAVICVLTLMILPNIIALSENAIRTVPKSYREASLGLGATKMQTIFSSVIPAAKSGILSATVLGIGRAIGETMAVMMIAGNPIGGIPLSIWDKVRPLTTNIAMEMSYASGRHQEMLFATGVILFIFIMLVNITLIRLTSGEKKVE